MEIQHRHNNLFDIYKVVKETNNFRFTLDVTFTRDVIEKERIVMVRFYFTDGKVGQSLNVNHYLKEQWFFDKLKKEQLLNYEEFKRFFDKVMNKKSKNIDCFKSFNDMITTFSMYVVGL